MRSFLSVDAPDAGLSDEQRAIRETTARILADHAAPRRAYDQPGHGADNATWEALAGAGIAGLLIPVDLGGVGLGPVELELVSEEMGAALAVTPFLSSSVLAASLILRSGDDKARATVLPAMASGAAGATVAVTGASGCWTQDGVDVEATTVAGRTVLTGRACFVTDADTADFVLVVATTLDGTGVYRIERGAAGLSIDPVETFDKTLRLADLTLEGVCAVRLGSVGWEAVEDALRVALVARAGEQVGGARHILDATVGYARTRVQFGRAIGSFQAIKHMAADLLLEVESATSAARHAARLLAAGAPDAAEAVDLAAFTCAEAFVRVAADAVQMHGGIAFTWDHPAHLYLRRARASSRLFGGPARFRDRFLEAVAARHLSEARA